MTVLPAAQCFKRIRVLCPDLARAVSEYELLLGRAADWQGELTQAQPQTQAWVGPHCASAWFVFHNCVIELLQAQVANPRIGGLVLGCDRFDPLTVDQLSELKYRSVKDQHRWSEYPVPSSSSRGLWLILETLASPNLAAASLLPSMPEPDMPRVDHLVLYSNDADACIATFAADPETSEPGLGLRLALDKRAPEWGGRMLFFRAGKFTLEVIQPNKPFAGADYFWGLALEVTQLESVHQRLSQAGVELSSVRTGRKPGTQVATVKSHQLGIPTLLIEHG